jgi:PAS domain S-box-containing protein
MTVPHIEGRLQELTQTLERAKKDWELTFDAVPDLIAIIDNNFTIRRSNRSLAARVGLSPQELIGRRCHELFHDGSATPHPDCPHLKMLAERNEQRTELEISVLGGFFEVTATPLYDTNGQLLGSVHIVHDITERIRVRQQQEEYQQQLQGLARTQNILQEKERRQLATTLHDQIGQTLALTRIKLGMLHNDLTGTHLSAQTYELRSLIDEVIEATRSLTIAISPPALYQMGLGAAIESLADSLRTTHGLDLTVIGDDTAADLAEETRIIFYQAVRELAINILKHAQVRTGEIIITRVGGKLAITVCDAGSGMSSPQPGNKSFGLFNIREQLTLVGGELQIDSQVKKGTRATISVRIPA